MVSKKLTGNIFEIIWNIFLTVTFFQELFKVINIFLSQTIHFILWYRVAAKVCDFNRGKFIRKTQIFKITFFTYMNLFFHQRCDTIKKIVI